MFIHYKYKPLAGFFGVGDLDDSEVVVVPEREEEEESVNEELSEESEELSEDELLLDSRPFLTSFFVSFSADFPSTIVLDSA